ncbi:MAG: phytoene desaturase family protein [Anaerolineae bacterium]|nr:phytoene desaturase family protein [Anaerolineae bacterium]MDW8098434.1 phytoene desaturase family protein [Anaerolineae bacterium]
MQTQRVIIIGSGFGGLAAGARLAARGYQVDIFEKLDKPGGRAYTFERDGFIFDGGPTVITAPFLFDELFEMAGRRRGDYVEFIPINPFYRIFDHQGRYFEYNDDIAYVQSQIERWNPADREGYRRFLDATRVIFQKGFVNLADKPFLYITDMLRVVPDLIRLQSYRSVYSYVAAFIQDEFLRRCFTFHPLLIGGNPFAASSIYAMIHYLEREWGVWYTRGGTGALVRALARLIEEQGGRFHFNAEVDEILVQNRHAVGVRLKDGSVHEADYIVSNADVPFTYMNLIRPQHRSLRNSDLRYQKLTKYSMSLVVIYFGTNRLYRDTPLVQHNIILSRRYKGLLDDIFAAKSLPKDFSLYLHVPTLTDPSLAPVGHEAFYVLSPVPHLGANIDWEQAARPYRDAIMQFLEDNYLPSLQQHIVIEHMIDPRYFRDCLNTYLGTGFSIQPVLTQSAWFRPHNRSEDIDNLYFVGAGTHPGAGLPGVVLSAKIVERLITHEKK